MEDHTAANREAHRVHIDAVARQINRQLDALLEQQQRILQRLSEYSKYDDVETSKDDKAD